MDILKVKELNYQDINNLSLKIEKGKITYLVGSNNSGKTTLLKIFSGIIMTNNIIELNNLSLNNNTKNKYLKKIGIVKRINENSFYHQKVKDEIYASLSNIIG